MPFSTVCVRRAAASSGTRAAPGVDWTQCVGQRRVVYCSCGLEGLVMVVVERKGCAGGGWLDAKEMWSGGCQSLVAILRGRVGSARRVLISGVMERPSGTGRAPFCVEVQSLWSHCGEEGESGGG